MLEHSQLDDIFSSAKPVDGEEPEAVADLAGYQVTRAELFSHTYEPAITIWPTRIKFNMACLRRFPGVTPYSNSNSPGTAAFDYTPLSPRRAGLSAVGERRGRKRAL